jgi:hypothetical protein
MEVFDAVRTVLAVRNYQDKPVSPEVVRRTVEAGRLTGSNMNRQPWHFIVVENRDMLRQLGALAKTGPYIAQAPLAIVVAIERTPFSVSDASRAIQSMVLTAWSEGVGSNWVGIGRGETAPEHPGRAGSIGYYPVWLSGSAHRQGQEKSQVDLRSRPSRAIRPTLRMRFFLDLLINSTTQVKNRPPTVIQTKKSSPERDQQ